MSPRHGCLATPGGLLFWYILMQHMVSYVSQACLVTCLTARQCTHIQCGVLGQTWIFAAHLPVDIAVHGAHDERSQGCEDHIVQRHVEVCSMTQANLHPCRQTCKANSCNWPGVCMPVMTGSSDYTRNSSGSTGKQTQQTTSNSACKMKFSASTCKTL